MPENAGNAECVRSDWRLAIRPVTLEAPKQSLVAVRWLPDPTEVKRVPGREYLPVRNQAKLTIKRSRQRGFAKLRPNARER
jgi:hypothetical protein